MLNYQIKQGEQDISILESEVRGGRLSQNPFPGLRPFGIEECHLYFGREDQIDEVLVKLTQNRFVSVLGFSGSGKSSLMYCGLIPVLYGGFMTERGPNWSVVVTRPGISPLDNLAESILNEDEEFQNASEEDRLIQHTITSSILRSGTTGLVDVLKAHHERTQDNILILIDQFEELFRFRKEHEQIHSGDPVNVYIDLLLEALNQTDVPIYLAMTMRSEFIGECSNYTGLTDMINTSNYLVPSMSREQKRMAIEGPVAVGGGKISHRLVKRLMNDLGRQEDQLPILQHALMRTWDYWVESGETDEPLDIRHYNAIGKLSGALSQHANEAFDELNDKQKIIAEVVFKTITEKRNDNTAVRRPARIREIAEIGNYSEDEVIEVVDIFRKPGRSLLMPDYSVVLTPESIIEISHESLVRIWTRLTSWVEDEYESAQMYRRLSEAAAMYQVGRTGLWRPPDLQLALNWQVKQKPTRTWAERYDEAFERAMVFLDTSRITYEAEQRNQELIQKRLLRRARAVAIFAAIAFIILVIFYFYALIQRLDAIKQAENAIKQQKIAEVEKERAERFADLALKSTKEASRSANLANVEAAKAKAAAFLAEYQRRIAQNALMIAQRAQEAEAQTNQQLVATNTVLTETNDALELSQADVQRFLHLSTAQSMASKSVTIEDADLEALLAQQAYIFHRDFEGYPNDKYIYQGLYEAMARYEGKNYNLYRGHKNAVRSVAFHPDGDRFFSGGSDGTIREWTTGNPGKTSKVIFNNGTHPNTASIVSLDGSWLINGSDSSTVQVFDLKDPEMAMKTISGPRSNVIDIRLDPSNGGFYILSNDNELHYSDYNTSKIIKRFNNRIKNFDIDPSGRYVVAGTNRGLIIKMDLKSFREDTIANNKGVPITSISINPAGNLLAYGDGRGTTHLLDLNTNKKFGEDLVGHSARISKIRFSSNGKMLATASTDKTIQLWFIDNLNELPIVMDDHTSFVFDIAFSPDNSYIIAATQSDGVKIWPTNSKYFADQLCSKISRSMTEVEWERFSPTAIKYRETCKTFNKPGGSD